MQLSEARAELYDAIEQWEHRKENATMSRLPSKHGYDAGETEKVEPVEWSVAKVGYLTEVSVTYRTGKDQLTRDHKQVPDHVEETLQEMLARRSITYPD